jgi:hypothetical protein
MTKRRNRRVLSKSEMIDAATNQPAKVPVGHESVTRNGYSEFIRLLPMEGTKISHSVIDKKIKNIVFKNMLVPKDDEVTIEVSPQQVALKDTPIGGDNGQATQETTT